ncbi:MAG: non-canonical purine NTP pyrophosphatase [Patescibacteria group bacterium]
MGRTLNKIITFATSNKGKILQANTCLQKFGITVTPVGLAVPEIQSHDSLKISEAKAKSAYQIIGKSLVICDFMWSINALNGFPGGYMKDIVHWFKPDDFLALMHGKKDRTILLTETVTYYDGSILKSFSSEYPGNITQDARGKSGVSIDQVVVYESQSDTIAECLDQKKPTRDLSESAWQKFGNWYVSK